MLLQFDAIATALPIAAGDAVATEIGDLLLAQRARSCKDVKSCEEAVELWCGGYRRADGDGDGIPCENVCSTKAEVDRIREEIGC